MLIILCTVVSKIKYCCGYNDKNMPLQNTVLISASESGDVMTAVSLLNSGADVQTKNEVYIHFL